MYNKNAFDNLKNVYPFYAKKYRDNNITVVRCQVYINTLFFKLSNKKLALKTITQTI